MESAPNNPTPVTEMVDGRTIVRHRVPSKINLFLGVLGRRPNGYHEIESVFIPLHAPADTLEFRPTENRGMSLSASDPDLPCDHGNLCRKAWYAYSKVARGKNGKPIPGDIHLHVRKRIPVAAGLGGGSGDAAAVLLYLNRRHKVLTDQELRTIARGIGADVPFFLDPRPVIARGVGEKMTPINVPAHEIPILLVAPAFPVSTVWSFRQLGKRPRNGGSRPPVGQMERLVTGIRNRDWAECAKQLRNDLEPAAFNKFPVMRMIRDALLANGALGVGMSGSGPVLFAICRDRDEAHRVRDAIRPCFPDPFRYFIPTAKDVSQ
jgi:4-diphosphocytidyl-2-C-methyl-D-erythritol kinase